MSKQKFPWIALAVGLVIALVLSSSIASGAGQEHRLPLLAMLLMAELGLIVSAVGAWWGMAEMSRTGWQSARLLVTLGCLALAAGFLYLGVSLWPTGGL